MAFYITCFARYDPKIKKKKILVKKGSVLASSNVIDQKKKKSLNPYNFYARLTMRNG